VTQARPGQALPLAALLLVGVLLVGGLAVDGGQLFLARRSLQAIADAAAYAGAQQVDVAHFRATRQVRLDRAAATEAAAAVLREAGLADAEVAALPDRVEVLARSRVSLLLMPLSGLAPDGLTVEAFAVVTPRATAIR
jgi:uncharacterized membrane protein